MRHRKGSADVFRCLPWPLNPIAYTPQTLKEAFSAVLEARTEAQGYITQMGSISNVGAILLLFSPP